ncbi:hypothetical protein E2C01_077332 [Portunus trituberculatus]|uniref:Uncharacterized protein n=1 Tax=Portunus trituberculatus TaxID=210409 RepID=A0A5B7IK09_PORTR|nr:hypothetical protein [Portunus trituberculatus]
MAARRLSKFCTASSNCTLVTYAEAKAKEFRQHNYWSASHIPALHKFVVHYRQPSIYKHLQRFLDLGTTKFFPKNGTDEHSGRLL